MTNDWKDIVNNLDSNKIVKLMDSLGVKAEKEDDKCIVFPTICHNADPSTASKKLYYYKDNKFFYCYTNCEGMSIFRFLEEYYKTRGIEYDWREDILKVAQSCGITNNLLEGFTTLKREPLTNKYIKRNEVVLPTYNKGVLEIFIKTYPIEWLRDRISKESMDKFNILYSISQNKIIIPHYNINGDLIGIRGRALEEDEIKNFGKYMPVKIENNWYNHPLSLNLYGLNNNIENIRKNRIVYLFEAEKSCLQFESYSLPNCSVAVCGSNFNKYQLNLLLKYCYPEEIIICFDKEEEKGQDKYFNKLWKIGKKYSNYCKFSFIYDKFGLLDMKDSPTDKGEEIFKKLFDSRVIIR